MLGKLAKWLRILGFDTFFDCSANDEELLKIARSEERALLTKDRELAAKGGYLVMGKGLENQVREIFQRFHLTGEAKPFTRCPVCNGELKKISRKDAEKLVPPLAFKMATKFSVCRECGKVYWDGTHMVRMKSLLRNIGLKEVNK